jgi:hypothetical protein
MSKYFQKRGLLLIASLLLNGAAADNPISQTLAEYEDQLDLTKETKPISLFHPKFFWSRPKEGKSS